MKNSTNQILHNAAYAAANAMFARRKKLNTAVWTACENHLITDPKQVREVFTLTQARFDEICRPT